MTGWMLAAAVGSCQKGAMDEMTAQLIKMAESRRNLACAMLAAHGSGQIPLTPDEVGSFRAEIDQCDAELSELRKGQGT